MIVRSPVSVARGQTVMLGVIPLQGKEGGREVGVEGGGREVGIEGGR